MLSNLFRFSKSRLLLQYLKLKTCKYICRRYKPSENGYKILLKLSFLLYYIENFNRNRYLKQEYIYAENKLNIKIIISGHIVFTCFFRNHYQSMVFSASSRTIDSSLPLLAIYHRYDNNFIPKFIQHD